MVRKKKKIFYVDFKKKKKGQKPSKHPSRDRVNRNFAHLFSLDSLDPRLRKGHCGERIHAPPLAVWLLLWFVLQQLVVSILKWTFYSFLTKHQKSVISARCIECWIKNVRKPHVPMRAYHKIDGNFANHIYFLSRAITTKKSPKVIF